MGATCSSPLTTSSTTHRNNTRRIQPPPSPAHHATDAEKAVQRLNPLGAHINTTSSNAANSHTSTSDDAVPIPVILTRMWNSVVCGELVKGQNIIVLDHNTKLSDAIATLREQSKLADYIMVRRAPPPEVHHASTHSTSNLAHNELDGATNAPIRTYSRTISVLGHNRNPSNAPLNVKPTNATATAATAVVKTSAARPHKVKEEYLGLIDWRDLNALLVIAIRRSRDQHELNANYRDSATQKAAADKVATTNTDKSGDLLSPSPVVTMPKRLSYTRSDAGSSFNASLTATTTAAAAPAMHTPIRPELEPFLHIMDMKSTPIEFVTNLCGRNPLHTLAKFTPLLGGAQLLVGQTAAHNNAFNRQQTVHLKANAATPSPNTSPPTTTINILSPTSGSSSSSSSSSTTSTHVTTDLYRIPILNSDSRFIGCMSQLSCATFISERLPSIGTIGSKTLHELGLGQRRVQTIGWKSPIFTAISLMHEKNISALAIVDSNGKLCGTISVSDSKFLYNCTDLMTILNYPVGLFIHCVRQSTTHWQVNLLGFMSDLQQNRISDANGRVVKDGLDQLSITARSPCLTLTTNITLINAVKQLLSHKVRRMWTVNDKNYPIGLLNVCDVVKLLLPNHPYHHVVLTDNNNNNTNNNSCVLPEKSTVNSLNNHHNNGGTHHVHTHSLTANSKSNTTNVLPQSPNTRSKRLATHTSVRVPRLST